MMLQASARRLSTPLRQHFSSFHFNHVSEIRNKWSFLETRLKRNGFVILTAEDSSEKTLLEVSSLFGKIQNHVRASKDGITEIRSQSHAVPGSKHVISNLAFVPHTDGTYLDGIALSNGEVYRVAPPKIVLLQCVKPDVTGGQSLLIDGQAILKSLLKTHSVILPSLFSYHAVRICRGSHQVNFSIYDNHPSKNLMIRFSYDKDLYISKWASQLVHSFNRDYILNSEFTTEFSLKENQIVVFDNHRLLHGRKEVKGERIFRRVWIQDESLSGELESPDSLAFFESNESSDGALDRLRGYTQLDSQPSQQELLKIDTGIHLSKEERVWVEKIILQTRSGGL